MAYLIIGLVLFIGVHSVSIVSRPWHDRMVERLGKMVWRGLHGLVALAGLALIVYGYGLARQAPVIVYVPPLWTRDITVPLMVLVFPLLFAAYLSGHIKRVMKHPMLVAVKLWATLHLLVNGSAADLLLFGSLLAWAVVLRISLKRHPRPATSTRPPSARNDVTAVVAGLVLYAVFIMGGHKWLIGVPIMLGH